MLFNTRDIVRFNPESLDYWINQRNYWFEEYNISYDDAQRITFEVLSYESGFGSSLVIISPTKDFSFCTFTKDNPCQLFEKDLVLADWKPLTVEEQIIKRIYKLYGKCKTTKHWKQGEVNV